MVTSICGSFIFREIKIQGDADLLRILWRGSAAVVRGAKQIMTLASIISRKLSDFYLNSASLAQNFASGLR
jgi:hypothetical protein